MLKAVRQETTVKPGGIVELTPTDLPIGATVEVIIVVNEVDYPAANEPSRNEGGARFYQNVVGAWKDDKEITQIFEEVNRSVT